jgi:hypothetical protein
MSTSATDGGDVDDFVGAMKRAGFRLRVSDPDFARDTPRLAVEQSPAAGR